MSVPFRGAAIPPTTSSSPSMPLHRLLVLLPLPLMLGAVFLLRRGCSDGAAANPPPLPCLGLCGKRLQPLQATNTQTERQDHEATMGAMMGITAVQGTPEPLLADADPKFNRLVQQTGVISRVVLRPDPQVGGHGLFTATATQPGDLLLEVPLSLCLLEPVNQGAEPAGTAALWERRLTHRLLTALETDQLWREYGPLLPPVETMGHPLLLPPVALPAIQHPALEAAVAELQEALWAAHPSERPDFDDEDVEWPGVRLWAFALVRSRSIETGDGRCALVPFLDMANHSDAPTAAWQCNGAVFRLRALKEMAAGEQATVQYRPAMDSQTRFLRYGFMEAGGNPHDRLPGMEKVKAAGKVYLSWLPFRAFLMVKGLEPDLPSTLPPTVVAVVKSLPIRSEGRPSQEEEAKAAGELCTALQALATKEFSTALDDDVQQLESIFEGKSAGGPLEITTLAYRIERKALFQAAIELLAQYQQSLMGPPNTSCLAKTPGAKDP